MKNITPAEALAALSLTIDSYTEGYTLEAESEVGDVSHTPNDFEMRLIEDAIQGLISEPEFARDFIAWQLAVMGQLKDFEQDPLIKKALEVLGGARHVAPAGSPRFIVIGHGESYITKICRQDEIVETIAGFIYESASDMPAEERKQWERDIANIDEWWITDPDLGPVHFKAGIGETDNISIWRVLDEPITEIPGRPGAGQ